MGSRSSPPFGGVQRGLLHARSTQDDGVTRLDVLDQFDGTRAGPAGGDNSLKPQSGVGCGKVAWVTRS